MTDVQYFDTVHSNENYDVRVVRLPDMSFNTYGIVNRSTGVIEQVQPNLYNATYIAEQFNKWLVTGPDSSDEVVAILTAFEGNGKAN